MDAQGDAEAMESLVAEIARSPSNDAVETLPAIGDDDAIVHLGSYAERHPALAGIVLEVLCDMESAKVERLARHLERRCLATGSR